VSDKPKIVLFIC